MTFERHVGLRVAAHLALAQLLVPYRPSYDGRHHLARIDALACALARVAPLHARDGATGSVSELAPVELDGARVVRGRLMLKDGRSIADATITRSDLRRAIALLKQIGVPEIGLSGADAPGPLAETPRG